MPSWNAEKFTMLKIVHETKKNQRGEPLAYEVMSMRMGNARPEFEYEIPVDEAEAMLATLCPHPLIEKTRYAVVHGGLRWHVDVFAGALKGLVIAECELSSQDQRVELPAWIGAEITGDPMYGNSVLARVPKVASAPGI